MLKEHTEGFNHRISLRRFCCSNASAFLFVTDWLDSQEVNIMNDHILFIPLITFMGNIFIVKISVFLESFLKKEDIGIYIGN